MVVTCGALSPSLLVPVQQWGSPTEHALPSSSSRGDAVAPSMGSAPSLAAVSRPLTQAQSWRERVLRFEDVLVADPAGAAVAPEWQHAVSPAMYGGDDRARDYGDAHSDGLGWQGGDDLAGVGSGSGNSPRRGHFAMPTQSSAQRVRPRKSNSGVQQTLFEL